MRKTIMVVDDEKDLVEAIKLKLNAEGYNVVEAFDGQEALDILRKKRPDLILLDIMMPHLNGYQVCREIKKDAKLKQIPVLMLTAKAQESDKFWGLETGADDYITKPFEFESLIESIKKHLLNEKTVKAA